MELTRSDAPPYAVSFDVFDTALRRKVRDPLEVFCLIAESIGDPGFFAARKKAQRDAHRFSNEATLAEIYRRLEKILGWSSTTATDVMELELSTERAILTPVAYTRDFIASYRESGFTICYVSDMYLPSSFIADALDRSGVRHSGERVFVSCEIGKSKRRGTLFPYLKTILPDLVTHYGDDYFADVLQAQRAGINGRFLPSARPTVFERHLSQPVAEVTRAARTSRTPLSPKLWELGAGLTAPLTHGFLQWLEREAQHAGIDRLLFLARDAQILHDLYAGKVPASYVYLSRHSLNNCIFSPTDASNREWIFDVSPPSIRNVLSNCNLKPKDVDTALLRAGLSSKAIDRRMTVGQLIQVMNPFFADSALQAQMQKMQCQQRDELRAYLLSISVHPDERLGVVDLGWRGSIQRRLTKILPMIGYKHPVKGFYYCCRATDLDVVSFLTLDAHWLSRYRVLIETMFPACHGQTIGYRAGKPVLGQHPHLTEADWTAFRDGARLAIEGLGNLEIEPRQLSEALGHLATEPDWHSTDLVSTVRFNAGLGLGDPFLQPGFLANLRAGMPWPEGFLRWRYPSARGFNYRVLRTAASALREARYARRWLLSAMYRLRKP